ncbi:FHA domain-containing protein [Microbacterium sp. X-17]|uniref:FHA domain-containing protein n=1 Tax=Microbacterium sp. X-17 TaxID=3144404 RepID=UPI0031F4DEB3
MFRYAPPRADAAAFAVVGGRFAVLAGGDAEDAAQLWEAVTSGDPELEDVLTVLARHGVRRTPDFALVEVLDPATGSMLVVVRGRGRVGIGAAWISAGEELQTWFETAAERVAEATLALDPVPGADAGPELLPLASGVVAASVLRWGAPAARPRTPGETTALGLSDEETILGSLRRRSGPAAEATAEADAPTILGVRRTPPTPTGYALVFDDGRVLRLGTEPVVVGRARRTTGLRGERWETLPSPAKEVSGTHAELRLASGILLVTDLDSTNGTVIAAHEEEPFVLRDGAAAHLAPGDRLDFGDGNAARFEADPPR